MILGVWLNATHKQSTLKRKKKRKTIQSVSPANELPALHSFLYSKSSIISVEPPLSLVTPNTWSPIGHASTTTPISISWAQTKRDTVHLLHPFSLLQNIKLTKLTLQNNIHPQISPSSYLNSSHASCHASSRRPPPTIHHIQSFNHHPHPPWLKHAHS